MDHHHTENTHQDHDDPALAELLDLDAEVLPSYLSEVTEWVGQLAEDLPRQRILDLGAGTGTGTIALAQRFGAAQVIALDSSPQMLSRIRSKALDLGLADRVSTVEADLDTVWPILQPVDVVWASMSLHHLAEPDRVLADALATIRSGGLLVAVEMDGPPRFLPEDLGLGRPGLEQRCHAALAHHQTTSLPDLGSDWGPRLERAGFVSVTKRTFTIDLRHQRSPSARRYAQGFVQRLRPALEGLLDADDLATLDVLVDRDAPAGLMHRGDLHIHDSRTAWAARRS